MRRKALHVYPDPEQRSRIVDGARRLGLSVSAYLATAGSGLAPAGPPRDADEWWHQQSPRRKAQIQGFLDRQAPAPAFDPDAPTLPLELS